MYVNIFLILQLLNRIIHFLMNTDKYAGRRGLKNSGTALKI